MHVSDRKFESTTDGLKDTVLNQLASQTNLAQFVSFSPLLEQRFAWLCGREPNLPFSTVEVACERLLNSSLSKAVNIRSFKPGSTKGHPMLRNLTSADQAAEGIRQKAALGLFTICNEVLPENDGGVSGVVAGDVMEFAPGIPKCVDEAGVASLPRDLGEKLLESVYGFKPAIDFDLRLRIEFSLHPIRCGYRREHTVVWEAEETPSTRRAEIRSWPNKFSQMIGDKAFGLLIAHLLGFSVPRTTVVGRKVAPFSFGQRTGTNETWLRTAPGVPVFGRYPTVLGWEDPFKLMSAQDPQLELSSILAQESVEFLWSGATRTTRNAPRINGVKGRGDGFMVAADHLQTLPDEVSYHVIGTHDELVEKLRSVKFEWVWDGKRVWVVQLHKRRKGTSGNVIYPGDITGARVFEPSRYPDNKILEELRKLIEEVAAQRVGIVVVGDVGVTSHIGDILEQARVPSRLQWRASDQLSFEDPVVDE